MRISDWSSDVCSSDLRAADGLSTSAEVGHDSPRGDSGADRVGGKRLAIWRNDAGPCLETAVGEQNIGGDDDRRGTRAFRDPVIGGIEAGPHHDPRDKRMDRYEIGRASCRERVCQYV